MGVVIVLVVFFLTMVLFVVVFCHRRRKAVRFRNHPIVASCPCVGPPGPPGPTGPGCPCQMDLQNGSLQMQDVEIGGNGIITELLTWGQPSNLVSFSDKQLFFGSSRPIRHVSVTPFAAIDPSQFASGHVTVTYADPPPSVVSLMAVLG